MDRILFVHHDGGLGGAPKSLSYILKSINRTNFDPILINICKGPSNDLFIDAGIKPLILKGARPFHGSTVVKPSLKLLIRNWVYFIPTVIISYLTLKKIKPDIVYLNSTCLFSFAIATKIWKKKIPVICHVREPIREGWNGLPLRFFNKMFVNGFIAISQFDLNSLHIPISNKKIKSALIYNFVDLSNYAVENKNNNYLKNNLEIKQNHIIFLYLARFSDANGWKELIYMAQKITNENQNFHFVLVGAPDTFNYEKWSNKNIHVLPFQNNIDKILQSADVFVCPFTEPHFARGVIEASAAGLPIIASNIGGVNELVIHNSTGFLYNSQDEFDKYVNKLGSDANLRFKMGNSGILFAKNHFSYEKNIDLTFDFINSFINKP
jgi:glycosyltransferase involved in cell wall biosynthesis